MLNLTVWPLRMLATLKKYHWVCPFVLISFYRNISYSLSEILIAARRFPLSNLDSNWRVKSLTPVG
jgi:hypothetical protein